MKATLGSCVLAAALAGCAGPPWLMGKPLSGRPSIPATTLNRTLAQRRAEAAEARAQGLLSREIGPLFEIEALERVTADERERLVTLLALRADDFAAMGRAIPRAEDLEHLARLAPAEGEALRAIRAAAARDAGDAWLAIGAQKRAYAAYQRAGELGAGDLWFRLDAATGRPPTSETRLRDLRQAIAALPLRALWPFGDLYLRKHGDDRAALQRLLAAARQAGDGNTADRLREALARLPPADDAAAATTSPPLVTPTPTPTPPADVDVERWVAAGPTLARRLLPLLATTQALLVGERARAWAQALQAEDPTSPDVHQVTALIDGLARRFGGVERKLTDLVYYSPDRYDGFLRAAAVWERVGHPRHACVQRLQAARWRDDPDDPLWRDAVACTHADPGAGDWRAIRQYVLDRTAPDRRDVVAASLDSALDGPAPIARPAP